ncbi:MAG: 4Fe-4S binding protein [Bacteroidales bacterium]|nr:4Fe-4S binding protein [Bacteroidales bacterium]
MEKLYLCGRKITNQKQEKMSYKIDPDSCTSCGSCQSECPQDAIAEGSPYAIDADLCVDCGACADVCPMEAIHAE